MSVAGVGLLRMHGRPYTHTCVHAWRYACTHTRPHKAPHIHPSLGVTVKVMTLLSGRGGGRMEVAACHTCANFDFKSWRKISERLNREGEKKLLSRSFQHQPPLKGVGGLLEKKTKKKTLKMFAEKPSWLPCFCSPVLISSVVFVFLEARARAVATRSLEWLLS